MVESHSTPRLSPRKKKAQKPLGNGFFGGARQAPAKEAAAAPSSSIPSSSPSFATPVHTLRPFNPQKPAGAAILPILLPPATLRPLAFRTFTKKHSLTLASSALQELAAFVGRHCGSGWREEGLAERVLEEVAKAWKARNGGVILDGASPVLKDILKTLEGNMSGGKIVAGAKAGLSRQNSLLLDPSRETDHSSTTRLGLRPLAALQREDSQTSMGMSGLAVEDEPDDEKLGDPRQWLKVVGAYDQPRMIYNVAKKHFERYASQEGRERRIMQAPPCRCHLGTVANPGYYSVPLAQRRLQTLDTATSLAQDHALPEPVQRDPPTAHAQRGLPDVRRRRHQARLQAVPLGLGCLIATAVVQDHARG